MMSLLGNITKFLPTIHMSALSLLQSEDSSRAYVYARNEAATLLASTLKWDYTSGTHAVMEYSGVTCYRDFSGFLFGLSNRPAWGVVRLGSTNIRIESESQLLAYLLVRFHSAPETCALTTER